MRNELSTCSPFKALPYDARKAIAGIAEEIHCDYDMVALTFLGVISNALMGATCKIKEDYITPCSLYIAIGAPPSSGKTPVVEFFRNVINEILASHWFPIPEEAAIRANIVRTLKAREKGIISKAKKCDNDHQRFELAAQLNEIEKKIAINKPILPIEIGNSTIQALPQELAVREGIGYILDAEGGLLSKLETISTNQLRPVLNAWSMESISDITKKKSITVSRPFLTTTSLWQTEPLLKVLNTAKYINVGLTARFLPLIASDSIGSSHTPKMAYGDAVRWIKNCLERVFIASKERLHQKNASPTFVLSPEGANTIIDFKAMLRDNRDFSLVDTFTGKADSHAARLAIALHSVQAPEVGRTISTETLTTACDLTTFFAKEHCWISNIANKQKILDEAKPILAQLDELFYKQRFEYILTKDVAKRSGTSNRQCEKILYWLEGEGYLRGYHQLSKSRDTEWEATRRLRSLLLDHRNVNG